MFWQIFDEIVHFIPVCDVVDQRVLALSGTVADITKNYVARTFKGSKEEPMLSVFPDIQAQHVKELKKQK